MENSSAITTEQASELRRDLDRIKSDLRQFRADFAGLTEDALRAAKSGMSDAKDRIDQKVKAAAAKGKESVEAVEDQVAAHPFMSLATAFTVGMVVGLGLSRKV